MFFTVLREYLKKKRGIDISLYKDNFLERRISLRLGALHIYELSDYIDLLKRDEKEVDNLINVLTVHVSEFFRNPELFHEIESVILPEIFSRNDRHYLFLSAGCASGEETYSLAMVITENFHYEFVRERVKILGVDISEESIRRAIEGIYSEKEIKQVPARLKRKYFEPVEGGMFRVNEKLRQIVEFRKLNLFEDRISEKMHLILCRNLLIYLNRSSQKILIENLKNMLRKGGYLVFGKTEGIYAFMNMEDLHTLSRTNRIYKLKGGVYA